MEERSFDIYSDREWKTIYPINECLENLKNLYEYQKAQIEKLAEKNAELSAEGWKDKELEDMRRQVKEAKNELRNGFGIEPDVKIGNVNILKCGTAITLVVPLVGSLPIRSLLLLLEYLVLVLVVFVSIRLIKKF